MRMRKCHGIQVAREFQRIENQKRRAAMPVKRTFKEKLKGLFNAIR
jgi:hypothetical protein